jgi:hypothetical protein
VKTSRADRIHLESITEESCQLDEYADKIQELIRVISIRSEDPCQEVYTSADLHALVACVGQLERVGRVLERLAGKVLTNV